MGYINGCDVTLCLVERDPRGFTVEMYKSPRELVEALLQARYFDAKHTAWLKELREVIIPKIEAARAEFEKEDERPQGEDAE